MISIRTLAFLLLASCADGGGKVGSGVGRPIASISTPQLWQGSGAGTTREEKVTILDLESGEPRVLQFQSEPFELVNKFTLPPGEYTAVAATAEYIIALDSRSIVVATAGGLQRSKSKAAESFVSILFEPRSNTVILTDKGKSFYLLKLAADGTITSEWRAGPKFADSYVESATVVDNDRALLKTTANKYYLVELTASIVAQAWISTQVNIELPADFITDAFAPGGGIVFGTSPSEVFTLKLPEGTIIDRLPLGQVLGKGRDFAPHLIVADEPGFVRIVTAGPDGKLKQAKVIGSRAAPTTTTYDPRSEILLAEIPPTCIKNAPYYGYGYNRTPECIEWDTGDNPYARIYRVRLSDNLLMDVTSLASDGRYVLTPDFVFLQRDSILGATERRSYGDDSESLLIERYNTDLLDRISNR
jgi:hypothetical protein